MSELRIAVRCPPGCSVLPGPPHAANEPLWSAAVAEGVTSVTYSDDGEMFAAVSTHRVTLHRSADFSQVQTIAHSGVVLAAWSPTKAFVVTCGKPLKEDGQPVKNLRVWDVQSGECVLQLTQRSVSKDSWPSLHWSSDDNFAFHMVTNAINVYSRENGFKAATQKLQIKGVSNFSVSPAAAEDAVVGIHVPEAKGQPSHVALYAVKNIPPPSSNAVPQPITRRSFFRAQAVRFVWNSTATAVLVLGFSDYDATNQSYYGEQKLYFLKADGSSDSLVPLPKEGPIYDFQWSPDGRHFAVVAGFMPAAATLFNDSCKPIFDFGTGPHNLIRWSPHSRFLCIAGFGNLPGDIVFWDKKADGACKQMGTVRCPSVLCSWSPCGRFLLTAITAPRLRVDNGIKIFTYYGELRHEIPFDVLFDAQWQPAPQGMYPDRPQSPERLRGPAGAANGSPAAKSAAASTASSYVPPHLRGVAAAAQRANMSFSLARDEGSKAGKISANSNRPAVPGATFVTKSASKNAKRRSKKKTAGGDDGDDVDTPADQPSSVPSESSASAARASAADNAAAAADVDKRVRNLQKKLRQVQQLKTKMAEEGASALEPEQLQKIETEASIISELEQLLAQQPL